MFVLLNLDTEHAINEVNIFDFDGTYGRDAVSCGEKMMNDNPIPVFGESAVFTGLLEKAGKFFITIDFFDICFYRAQDDFTLGDIVVFHHPVGNDAVISEIGADGHLADFFNIKKKAAQLAVKVITLEQADGGGSADVYSFCV